MKKFVVQVIICLLMVAPLLGEPYERTEEYARKQAILNERAVRFKAETGFEGDITFNHQDMKFSQLYGTFNDIHLSVPCDTVLAGQALDQIMLRFTPFTLAREGQLVLSRHVNSRYMVTKIWKQVVNGYTVHPGGIISISYNIDTQEFIINDATVDIPNTPIPINISKEDAQEILFNVYKQSEFYDNRITRSYREPSIGYIRIPTSKDPLQYRLCWSLGFFSDGYCIDVETLEIFHNKAHILRSTTRLKAKHAIQQ